MENIIKAMAVEQGLSAKKIQGNESRILVAKNAHTLGVLEIVVSGGWDAPLFVASLYEENTANDLKCAFEAGTCVTATENIEYMGLGTVEKVTRIRNLLVYLAKGE